MTVTSEATLQCEMTAARLRVLGVLGLLVTFSREQLAVASNALCVEMPGSILLEITVLC